MSRRGEKQAMNLPDIGKKLVGGVPQKEALLKLLKAAASQLQEVQQSAGVSTTTAIKPCVQALVKPQYLKHKDKDVRLLSAFCCSEAMRVFAPDPPYTDPELKEIFQLFVAIFHRLEEVHSPSFNRIVGILETLAKVKTCIVMLDLELDSLILEMFHVFFRKVSEEHPRNVHTAMLDVMGTIIDESEDISQALLDTVISNLLERTREKSPAAYQLAVAVVQRCADHLQPVVQRFLTSVMESPESVESELNQDYHELIYEIYKAAPQILVAVLPSMLEEVRKEDIEKRLKAVDVLGKIFSLPEQHAHQDYRQLYAEYMKRYTDKSVDIRLKMVEWSQSYLLNTAASDATDHIDALAGRLLDHDDKIRMQSVKVFCHIARTKPKIVPTQVLKEVPDRLRDKKLAVRRFTMAELAKVYRQYCIRCLEGKDSPSEEFEWISNKLFLCCFDKDVKEFKPQAFDLFLDEELFPAKLPIENRARHWISIYAAMEENAAKVLASLFKAKARTQQEMANYLEVRKKLKEEEMPELQQQLQIIFNNVAAAFVESGKAEEHLKKLHQLKDNNIFKALATLLDPKTTHAQARTIREELMKRLGEKHPQHEFIRDLATKISFGLFGEEHVEAILKLIKDKKLTEPELLSASMKLLVEVSTHFPVLFESFQANLVKMLTEGDSVVKDGAANILAKAGDHLRDLLTDTSGPVSETLQKLALEGTRKQAKHAIEAIASLSEDEGLKDLSLLYQRLVDSLENDTLLPTAFQSLGSIAQHAMPVFETREDDIIKFVVRNVLRRKSDHYKSEEANKHRKFDWENPSKVCQLKVQGLKVLVKSFLPLRDTPARPRLRGLLNVLYKLIPIGELSEDLAKESTEVDRAHIRLAAAKAVLRLARRYDHYMQTQLPSLFSLTMLTAQDPCFQVRQKIVAKVHQYLHLRESPLPHKYACCFALDAIDVEKTNVALSKRYLAEFVEASRREAVVRQVKAVSGAVEGSTITLHPEYVLVYLVHVLAHHPDFPKGEEDSAELYEPFKVQLQAFLRSLLQLDGEAKSDLAKKDEADSLPAILAILRTVKSVPGDAVDNSKLELVYTVCDIGIMLAKELGRKKLYSGEYPGAIPLPVSLYKAPEQTGEGTLGALEKVDGSQLPKCLSEEAAKPKPKPAALPRPALATNARGKKRGKVEEKDTQETDDTQAAGTPETVQPPQKKTRNGDISADTKSAKATPKTRVKAAPMQTPKTVPALPKAAEDSPAARSTPRTTVKSPAREKKGGGPELVGRKIRVWWPLDKAFYQGRIQSFDDKKRTHQITYDDGDVESLNLLRERWELVDSAEVAPLPSTEPAPAAAAPPAEPTMPTAQGASSSKGAAAGGKKPAAASPAKGKSVLAEAAAGAGKSPERKRKREAAEGEGEKKGKAQKGKGKGAAGQTEAAKDEGRVRTHGEALVEKGNGKGKATGEAAKAVVTPGEEAVQMEVDAAAGAGGDTEGKQSGRSRGKGSGAVQVNGEAKGKKRKEPEAKAPISSPFDYIEKDEWAEQDVPLELVENTANVVPQASEGAETMAQEPASKASKPVGKEAKGKTAKTGAGKAETKKGGSGGKKGSGKSAAELRGKGTAEEGLKEGEKAEAEEEAKVEEEAKGAEKEEAGTEMMDKREEEVEEETGEEEKGKEEKKEESVKEQEKEKRAGEEKVGEEKAEGEKAEAPEPARRFTRGRAMQAEVVPGGGKGVEARASGRKAPAKGKAAAKNAKHADTRAGEGLDEESKEGEGVLMKETEEKLASVAAESADGKKVEGEGEEPAEAGTAVVAEKETEDKMGKSMEGVAEAQGEEEKEGPVQMDEMEAGPIGEEGGPADTAADAAKPAGAGAMSAEAQVKAKEGAEKVPAGVAAGGKDAVAGGAEEKVDGAQLEEGKEGAEATEGEAGEGAECDPAAAVPEDDEPLETVRSRRRKVR